jgi:hypothetical protein
MGEKTSWGCSAIAATVFIGLQFFLYVGEISYPQGMRQPAGADRHELVITWFAPIPYLFRPTDPSCVVHTGTRVALNAAGIAKYADTTVSAVADRAVKGASPHDNNAYWVRLRGALADYGNRNEHVANITEVCGASIRSSTARRVSAPRPVRRRARRARSRRTPSEGARGGFARRRGGQRHRGVQPREAHDRARRQDV